MKNLILVILRSEKFNNDKKKAEIRLTLVDLRPKSVVHFVIKDFNELVYDFVQVFEPNVQLSLHNLVQPVQPRPNWDPIASVSKNAYFRDSCRTKCINHGLEMILYNPEKEKRISKTLLTYSCISFSDKILRYFGF